jgi:hypothetical protein
MDSNLPSDLSASIDKRLESILKEIKFAPADDKPEEDNFT